MTNMDQTDIPRWPPQRGDIWLTKVGWTGSRAPKIPIGSAVLILDNSPARGAIGYSGWWSGNVMGPYGSRWIKVAEGDIDPFQRMLRDM